MIVSLQSNKLNIIIYLRAVPAIYVAFVHYIAGTTHIYIILFNFFPSARAGDSRHFRAGGYEVSHREGEFVLICRGYFFYFVLDFRFI